MRFSLRLNNDLGLPDYVALAQAAERAGFDQIWVSNDLFLQSAPVILSSIAAHTERLEFGTGILNPYTLNPAEIAMLAATLDELSGCRFNLGLAAGAGDFLHWVGIEQSHPLAAMRETIIAIRALLRGERVPTRGKFLNWSNEAYMRIQAPRVTPIYLGAMSAGMLRLAGELADGVLPLLFPPEHYFEVRPHLEQGKRSRAPELGELDFAVCIWASISDDRSAARRALAQKVAYYGYTLSPMILSRLGLVRDDFGPIEQALMVKRDEARAVSLVTDQMLKIGVVGQPEDLIARLEPLVKAGAKHLSFGPPLGPDPFAAVELLGRQVLPHLSQW
jgi:5,10-methylenetetrahydromethanopterin reductase